MYSEAESVNVSPLREGRREGGRGYVGAGGGTGRGAGLRGRREGGRNNPRRTIKGPVKLENKTRAECQDSRVEERTAA